MLTESKSVNEIIIINSWRATISTGFLGELVFSLVSTSWLVSTSLHTTVPYFFQYYVYSPADYHAGCLVDDFYAVTMTTDGRLSCVIDVEMEEIMSLYIQMMPLSIHYLKSNTESSLRTTCVLVFIIEAALYRPKICSLYLILQTPLYFGCKAKTAICLSVFCPHYLSIYLSSFPPHDGFRVVQ